MSLYGRWKKSNNSFLQAFLPDTSESIFYQINTELKDFDSIKEFGGYE